MMVRTLHEHIAIYPQKFRLFFSFQIFHDMFAFRQAPTPAHEEACFIYSKAR